MNEFLTTIYNSSPVIWILVIFSIAALGIVMTKLFQFTFLNTVFFSNVNHYLQDLLSNRTKLELFSSEPELRKHTHNPRVAILAHAFDTLNQQDINLGELKTETHRFAKSQINSLNTYLRGLEVIAYLSPLLGLFGTVLGMIEAFKAMEAAGSQVDPALLSGGIWQALSTTALGLAVAIPVSLVHSWFERKIEVTSEYIQDDLNRFFLRVSRMQLESLYKPKETRSKNQELNTQESNKPAHQQAVA
jgi:biopolymer transport protein ExbB